MYFAGQGFGYTDLTRPPLFPFLTSLIFRLGVVSESVIFYLDASFLVFGAVGLYLFLRMKFESMESFLGSLLFSTFPVVVLFTGVGLTDIPSVALSIWALYATVLAVKKNPLFFYFSFPLAMLAFLTRYPAGFIIFPIFFYLVINRHEVSLKNMIGGILLSLLPGLIVFLFFYNQFGNPLGPFSSFYGSTQKAWSTTYVYYHPDPLYFLKHILSYIGVGGMIIILGLVISAFISLVTKFNNIKLKFKQYSVPEMAIHTKIKVLTLFLLFSLFIITFARTHYFISEIIFLVFCFVLFYTLRNSNIKDLDIHLFFISWFMAFFIFHSVYTVKDDRYFITMAPALTYFLILGFIQIKRFWTLESKYKNMVYNIFAVILVFMMLIAAADYITGIYDHESQNVVELNEIKMASQWLEVNDPQYLDKNISSDQWPYFSWYLKTNVTQVQLSNSNKDYENNLNTDNANYFLTVKEGLNLTNYQLIKQFGYVTIYKRQ
ncbi:MAG: glycosyltransferase family 39 protein [Methanobacterium formicicum]